MNLPRRNRRGLIEATALRMPALVGRLIFRGVIAAASLKLHYRRCLPPRAALTLLCQKIEAAACAVVVIVPSPPVGEGSSVFERKEWVRGVTRRLLSWGTPSPILY